MGTANEVLKKFNNGEVKYLDMRFTDPKGKLQHLTMDGTAVDDDLLNSGVFFDGSSISCLLYTSPSPRDNTLSRMPSSA